MSDTSGSFIVFEGCEGSGKSTQARLLQEKLPVDTKLVREPGGTEVAEKIRDILLDRDLDVSEKADLALFCASRADLVEKVIKPALENGQVVIADRFDLSTIAYQIYGRENEQDLDYLLSFSDYVVGDTQPSRYIYLDVPVEVGLGRVGGRDKEDSRIDQEEIAFHKRVRRGYKKIVSSRDDCVEIDAERNRDAVTEDVWRVVQQVVGL